MKSVAFIALFILVSVGISQSQEDDQLVGVAVCFRHGDRSPITSYPNDPYIDLKYWPDGLGQLLDKGKANHFNVGKWLRSRYSGFISERYSPYEMVVKSTDVDRTLTSAASNLAGLYYPQDQSQSNIWPEDLPWNPVPIHTVPQVQDEILAMDKECKNFEDLNQETIQSEYFKNVLNEYKNITEFVESKTGWNITDLSHFQGLQSVFYVYRMHNASYLPDWAYELDQDELSYLAGLSYSTETFYPRLQRFKVGPLFNYLNNYFDGIVNGTNPKFLMLSAHDGTVAAILNSYGAYDYHPPEFCAMIIWEVYKTSAGDVYLKIFYRRNSETESVEEVIVGNCSSSCSYGMFKELIQNITVDSDTWENECNQNLTKQLF